MNRDLSFWFSVGGGLLDAGFAVTAYKMGLDSTVTNLFGVSAVLFAVSAVSILNAEPKVK